MANQRNEFWTKEAVAILQPDDLLVRFGSNHSAFVEGEAVNVPQAVLMSGEVDRSTFPAIVTEARDGNLRYLMHDYTTDPVAVRHVENKRRTYDMKKSVLQGHMDTTKSEIGSFILSSWADQTTDLKSTGTEAFAGKKALTEDDVSNMAMRLDEQGVPSDKRFLALTPRMLRGLFKNDAVKNASFFGSATLPKGVIAYLHGFKIFQRTRVGLYDSAGNLKAYNAKREATDFECAIAFHEKCVSWAMSSPKVFTAKEDPLFYGDVISTQTLFGGSKVRTDGSGVVCLSESNA